MRRWVKQIAVVLVVVLTFMGTFSGCKSATQTSENSKENSEQAFSAEDTTRGTGSLADKLPEDFTLAMVVVTTSGGLFQKCAQMLELAGKACGFKVIYDVGAVSPEEQITSVENVISAGADAIVFINFTTDVLPKVAQICDENKVHWAQFLRDVTDEEILSFLKSSKYYVGRAYTDEAAVALDALASLKENGVTKAAIVGPTTGDITTDTRAQVFKDNAADYGIEVITEVRTLTDATDAAEAVNNIVASYPDCDGIFCISGSDSRGEGCIQALQSLGKAGEIKLAMVDFIDGIADQIDNGTVTCAIGGQYPNILFTTMMLVNQLSGNPLNGEDKVLAKMHNLVLKSSADCEAYFKYCEGEDGALAYNEDEIRALCKYFNPDLTYEKFQEVCDSYGMEDVLSRRQ
jgi:ribose transport system substrate-binding protein